MDRGKLIVIEGSDCTGKDTLINSLNLPSDKFIISREPGGTKIGQNIRDVLLDVDNDEIDDLTSFLLFNADRRNHIVNKIAPAILSGKNVVLNRYYHSSIVYQAILGNNGNGLPSALTSDIIKSVVKTKDYTAIPDLIIILYSSEYPLIQDRLESKNKDRIEMNNAEYFNRVNEEYSHIYKSYYISSIEKSHSHRYMIFDVSKYKNNIEKLANEVQLTINLII